MSGILQETILGLMNTVSSNITDTPCYLNHIPQTLVNGNESQYPCIIFNVISSPRTYSMKDGSGDNHTYSRVRVQFTVFGNEDQQQEAMDISDELENLFKFKSDTLDGDVNWICTHISDQNIKFYEEGEKVWSINTDMIFTMGD
jgi:hypothetical protein